MKHMGPVYLLDLNKSQRNSEQWYIWAQSNNYSVVSNHAVY